MGYLSITTASVLQNDQINGAGAVTVYQVRNATVNGVAVTPTLSAEEIRLPAAALTNDYSFEYRIRRTDGVLSGWTGLNTGTTSNIAQVDSLVVRYSYAPQEFGIMPGADVLGNDTKLANVFEQFGHDDFHIHFPAGVWRFDIGVSNRYNNTRITGVPGQTVFLLTIRAVRHAGRYAEAIPSARLSAPVTAGSTLIPLDQTHSGSAGFIPGDDVIIRGQGGGPVEVGARDATTVQAVGPVNGSGRAESITLSEAVEFDYQVDYDPAVYPLAQQYIDATGEVIDRTLISRLIKSPLTQIAAVGDRVIPLTNTSQFSIGSLVTVENVTTRAEEGGNASNQNATNFNLTEIIDIDDGVSITLRDPIDVEVPLLKPDGVTTANAGVYLIEDVRDCEISGIDMQWRVAPDTNASRYEGIALRFARHSSMHHFRELNQEGEGHTGASWRMEACYKCRVHDWKVQDAKYLSGGEGYGGQMVKVNHCQVYDFNAARMRHGIEGQTVQNTQIYNFEVEDCLFAGVDPTHGLRGKNNVIRDGVIIGPYGGTSGNTYHDAEDEGDLWQNIRFVGRPQAVFHNVTIDGVFYEEFIQSSGYLFQVSAPSTPILKGCSFENAEFGINLRQHDDRPDAISGIVRIEDCTFKDVDKPIAGRGKQFGGGQSAFPLLVIVNCNGNGVAEKFLRAEDIDEIRWFGGFAYGNNQSSGTPFKLIRSSLTAANLWFDGFGHAFEMADSNIDMANGTWRNTDELFWDEGGNTGFIRNFSGLSGRNVTLASVPSGGDIVITNILSGDV